MPAFELDPDAPLQVTAPEGKQVTGDVGRGPAPGRAGERDVRVQVVSGCAATGRAVCKLSEVARGGSGVPEGHRPSRRPALCAPPRPQASLVHTTETIRIRFFMDLLMAKSRPVMLVGNAGTGKSVLMGDKLDSLSTDDYLVQAVPFNFYTTSAMLQGARGAGGGAGGRGPGRGLTAQAGPTSRTAAPPHRHARSSSSLPTDPGTCHCFFVSPPPPAGLDRQSGGHRGEPGPLCPGPPGSSHRPLRHSWAEGARG